MKTVCLISLTILLPYALYANAAAILPAYQYQPVINDDDLTPPAYVPGTPIRYGIPIYDLQTRQIITTASSICALQMYAKLNHLDHLLLHPEIAD
jgi:hypothetical protein